MQNLKSSKSLHQELVEIQRLKNNTQVFKSSFDFLNAHKGIRLGCVHGVIGPMHCGKSSLLKNLIVETAYLTNVLVWLSEETRDQYQLDMSIPEKLLNRINWFREMEIGQHIRNNLDQFYKAFEQVIVECRANVVFIDNVTTSAIYSDMIGIKNQSISVGKLLDLAKRTGVAIFYVAHTKKEITANFQRPLTAEDIRGNAQLAIQSEYVYLFHKYTIKEKQLSIIKVEKHRYHTGILKKFYMLNFLRGSYINDKQIDFERLKEIFNERDKL